MSLSRDLSRLRRASPSDRRLLLEAMIWLALLRPLVLTLPYRWVAHLLQLAQSGSSERLLAGSGQDTAADPGNDGAGGYPQDGAAARRRAERIGWAVRTAAARTPWRSTCLVQSLAGHVLLRRHDLPSAVLLGVGKDGRGEFIAHSWLRCADQILTGQESQQQYSVIAAYRPRAGSR